MKSYSRRNFLKLGTQTIMRLMQGYTTLTTTARWFACTWTVVVMGSV